MYFIAKYDTDLLSKEKALGKKTPCDPPTAAKVLWKPTEYCQSPTKVETGRKTHARPSCIILEKYAQPSNILISHPTPQNIQTGVHTIHCVLKTTYPAEISNAWEHIGT